MEVGNRDNYYCKGLKFNIIKRKKDKAMKIGELTGHFFNFQRINRKGLSDKILEILNLYGDETFSICSNLCMETKCFKGKGQNIFHLDRFYIEPDFRGSGLGREILYNFRINISSMLNENVRYMALYPDPITSDPSFDSLYDMDIDKRNRRVKNLKGFYSSLGFKEMNSNKRYMYLDRYNRVSS